MEPDDLLERLEAVEAKLDRIQSFIEKIEPLAEEAHEKLKKLSGGFMAGIFK